jgi:hypothetical protein
LNMPHLPSFLVGSIVSGTAFLIVHEQLSHRTRLSKKWKLREIVENKCGELLAKARSVRDEQSNTRNVQGMRNFSLTKTWNDGIAKVQNALGRDE